MTTYQLTFDPNFGSPNYGITVICLPGYQATTGTSEFPQVNIGGDQARWVERVSALFSNWAVMYQRTIIIQVADNGNLSAWMMNQ